MADDSCALPVSDWAESFRDVHELKAYIEEEYPAAYKHLLTTASHHIEIQDEPDVRSKHISVLIGELASPLDPNNTDENEAFAYVSTKTGKFGFRTLNGEILEIEDIQLAEPFCWFPERQKHAFTYYASPLDLEAYIRYYIALHGHNGHFRKFPNSTGVRTKLAYHLNSAGITIADARSEGEVDEDGETSPAVSTPGTSRAVSDDLYEAQTPRTSLAVAPFAGFRNASPTALAFKKSRKVKLRKVQGRETGRLPSSNDTIQDLKSQLKSSRDEVEDLRSELQEVKATAADEASLWKEKYEKLRSVMSGVLEESR